MSKPLSKTQIKKELSLNSRALVQAAKDNNVAELTRLMDVADCAYHECLAFRMAAKHGSFECLQLLAPHSVINCKNSIALRRAAELGHMGMIEFLLPHCDPTAQYGEVLTNTIRHGHWEAFERFLPLCDPKSQRSHALSVAAVHGRLDFLKRLIPLSDVDASGAIGMAAHHGHAQCVQELIPYCDLHREDSNLWEWTLDSYRPEIVRVLLPYFDPNSLNHKAIIMASKHRDEDMVEQLFAVCDQQKLLEDMHNSTVEYSELQLIRDQFAWIQKGILEQALDGASSVQQRRKL